VAQLENWLGTVAAMIIALAVLRLLLPRGGLRMSAETVLGLAMLACLLEPAAAFLQQPALALEYGQPESGAHYYEMEAEKILEAAGIRGKAEAIVEGGGVRELKIIAYEGGQTALEGIKAVLESIYDVGEAGVTISVWRESA